MISHKHKLIYIHIPKTGGTYLEEEILRKEYEAIGWQSARYIEDLDEEFLLRQDGLAKVINYYSNYRIFTFVRNPWARALSLYLMYEKDANLKRNDFDEFISCLLEFSNSGWDLGQRKEVFSKFLDRTIERGEKRDWWIDQLAYHSIEQYRFLLKDPVFFNTGVNKSIDFIGKFENLHEDFLSMCNKFNLPKPKNFHQKDNPVGDDYKRFYNNKTRSIIKQIYHRDIELFNYSFWRKKGIIGKVLKIIKRLITKKI